MGEDPDRRAAAAPRGGHLIRTSRRPDRDRWRDRERELFGLARLYGVQTSYVDLQGRRRRASPGTILQLARALGAPVERMADVPGGLRDRRRALWRRPIEPAVVAWDGAIRPIRLRLPAAQADRRARWRLQLEDGDEIDVSAAFGETARRRRVAATATIDGRDHVELEILPSIDVPLGRHRLAFEAGRTVAAATVLAAPAGRPVADLESTWGVFLPLYALRSERSWGTGDLADLGDLLEWVAGLGGGVVATLPILASFLDEPFEPSPYSPASRMLWNELYLDVSRVPELQGSPEARAILRSAALRREVSSLRDAPVVDYRAAIAPKRRVLEMLARTFFAGRGASARRAALDAFERSNPRVRDYAAFMAACERHRGPWGGWPAAEREGRLPRGGGSSEAGRYHRYVQWLMAEQMDATARRAREAGTGLYFDFPVGVNAASYDVWRERAAFAVDASAGAPPDPFFTAGQDWGFPPLHPERIREDGYRYFSECLRHMFRHAAVLRIDHVMGLHRMYWVPKGMDALQGAYVKYRPEEFYAVLAIEARRGRAVIVGEDLGTVPHAVRQAMARHGLYRSYVMQMELEADPRRAVRPPPRRSMASLNSHDMPPFAAFWRSSDMGYRMEQGWLDPAAAAAERTERERVRRALVAFLERQGLLHTHEAPSEHEVLTGSLRHLARSDAGMVIVNLEDLWLETRPQNVPGTVDQYPNWRRPARHRFESFRRMPPVVGTLEEIDRARRGER